MLSSELENLAANVRRLHRDGVPVTPLILENLANRLDTMADRARALERHTVPFAARQAAAGELGPAVVPLRRFAGGDVS